MRAEAVLSAALTFDFDAGVVLSKWAQAGNWSQNGSAVGPVAAGFAGFVAGFVVLDGVGDGASVGGSVVGASEDGSASVDATGAASACWCLPVSPHPATTTRTAEATTSCH